MHFDELHAKALPFDPPNDSERDRDRKSESRQKQLKLERLRVFNHS
jgi:hypothetical protein